MHSIEDLGLLKMDFLGLKNLTIIEDTLSRIYMVQNKKIDIEKLPLDDKKTYKIFRNAETTGVFQLESDGMKRYLKELKPSIFEDIVAMVALYRPGPMQFIPEYIGRKNKKRKTEYLHPKLKPILQNTYGICIFQEQLMQIARVIAGFSLSEADILRKAIGKKIEKLLFDQKEKFIKGTIKNKIKKEIGEKIWDWILPFARYGFNRAHATAYAKIAYQTAYLKAHFPVEFMSALLTSEKTDLERIAYLIEECKNMEIEVLPPDINESFRNFSVVPNKQKIRFGLLAIKNVGSNIVEVIIKERKNAGKFKSITDFISRIDSKDLNKRSLESLIKTGAFDNFEERNKLLSNMEEILNFNREIRKAKTNGQKSLFHHNTNNPAPLFKLKDEKPLATSQKLLWEKELLGLYISSHPLESFKNILNRKTISIKELKAGSFPYTIRVGGIILSVKKILTKKGKPMLFVKLEDLTDKIEIIVFSSTLEKNPTAFQENKIVFITGRVDTWNNTTKIICENIEEIIEK
jgi:DNA polymerase-3 subunit alpha